MVLNSRLRDQLAWVHDMFGPQFHHLQNLKDFIDVKDLEKIPGT